MKMFAGLVALAAFAFASAGCAAGQSDVDDHVPVTSAAPTSGVAAEQEFLDTLTFLDPLLTSDRQRAVLNARGVCTTWARQPSLTEADRTEVVRVSFRDPRAIVDTYQAQRIADIIVRTRLCDSWK